MAEPLLRVEDLSTHFFTSQGVVRAVNDVTYDIQPGETMGLVGESGSGKSVSALSLMRLIPNPPGKIVAGEVWFGGENILEVSDQRIREIRGNEIAMVFQEPMTSLNPVLTIGRQLTEALQLHLKMNIKQANARAVELLHMVGIPAADERLFDYPHQFSGGMRQRVMIAMALSCDPKLLLADEPTTALDVTIQAQVLEVMARLSRELGTAVVVITHNLGVVARYADRVNVMYGGRIVEMGPADEIYHAPQHAYTLGLLESVPRLDEREGRLLPIEGSPPDLTNLPPGCSFAPRCRFATDQCREERPDLIEVTEGHKVACWESEAVLAEARAKVLSAAVSEE
ncbi:MAG: oligopeptide transport system ATP-binding protein [Chloroflexi bacterium]|jgi:oligopeptide transport system ATP-binding protein|nr:MAG: oligopeptide transport system ATP-binding protein [Chloroflexota bacterium]